jgi:hypothetical protein
VGAKRTSLSRRRERAVRSLPLELVLARLEGGRRVEEIDVGRENLWDAAGGEEGRRGGARQ